MTLMLQSGNASVNHGLQSVVGDQSQGKGFSPKPRVATIGRGAWIRRHIIIGIHIRCDVRFRAKAPFLPILPTTA
jgi:hypothetical protein